MVNPRILGWIGGILSAVLLTTACSSDGVSDSSDSATPKRSDSELAAAWWNWAASEPDPTNPVADDSGEDCARNQPDDVWFLAGNFGGETQRTCSVPAGRELFFPVLSAFCSEGEGCEEWFDDAELEVVVDRDTIKPTEIDTDLVEISTVEGNSVTGGGGRFSVIVAGWWVRLPALPTGPHQVEIYGRSAQGFEVSVIYELTVSPKLG